MRKNLDVFEFPAFVRLIRAHGLYITNSPKVFSIYCVNLAIQTAGCRRDEAIEEPNAAGKVVGPIPL